MSKYRREARRAAARYGLDPGIFERQIGAESGFNPSARSPAGALGIAQIMPATARGWGVNPLNPSQALDAAAKNMARYVKQYGGYENALRAYNAGPAAIQRSRGFRETNNYVAKILGGQDPKRLGRPQRGGGGTPGVPGLPAVNIPGQITEGGGPRQIGMPGASTLRLLEALQDREQPRFFSQAPPAPAHTAQAVMPRG